MATRIEILDAALGLLAGGDTVSLDSVARRVGLTKAGLMHHVPTKQALMLGIVDRVLDRYEEQLAAHVGVPLDEASWTARTTAYLEWSLTSDLDRSDLAMFTDPRLLAALTEQWGARMSAWIDVPASLPTEQRVRLTTVRLIADGHWLAEATGIGRVDAVTRDGVRALADRILADDLPGGTA